MKRGVRRVAIALGGGYLLGAVYAAVLLAINPQPESAFLVTVSAFAWGWISRILIVGPQE